MPNEIREAHAETIQLLFAWGLASADVQEDAGSAAWWLSGGVALLVWTLVVLLLTAA